MWVAGVLAPHSTETQTLCPCRGPKAQERMESTHLCFHLVWMSAVGRFVSAPWVSDSLAERNWALLPKINVPSPAPWLPAPAH